MQLTHFGKHSPAAGHGVVGSVSPHHGRVTTANHRDKNVKETVTDSVNSAVSGVINETISEQCAGNVDLRLGGQDASLDTEHDISGRNGGSGRRRDVPADDRVGLADDPHPGTVRGAGVCQSGVAGADAGGAAVKPTPGPWMRDITSGMSADVRAANGRKVALCWGLSTSKAARSNSPRYRDECDANATLIAAAPDLLAALRYARRFLNSTDHDTAFVDAAIAKAEGTAP